MIKTAMNKHECEEGKSNFDDEKCNRYENADDLGEKDANIFRHIEA